MCRQFGLDIFHSCSSLKHITAGDFWGVREWLSRLCRRKLVMQTLCRENHCVSLERVENCRELPYCVDMSTACICTYSQWRQRADSSIQVSRKDKLSPAHSHAHSHSSKCSRIFASMFVNCLTCWYPRDFTRGVDGKSQKEVRSECRIHLHSHMTLQHQICRTSQNSSACVKAA